LVFVKTNWGNYFRGVKACAPAHTRNQKTIRPKHQIAKNSNKFLVTLGIFEAFLGAGTIIIEKEAKTRDHL